MSTRRRDPNEKAAWELFVWFSLLVCAFGMLAALEVSR